MSDVSGGPGWSQAADGRWYPTDSGAQEPTPRAALPPKGRDFGTWWRRQTNLTKVALVVGAVAVVAAASVFGGSRDDDQGSSLSAWAATQQPLDVAANDTFSTIVDNAVAGRSGAMAGSCQSLVHQSTAAIDAPDAPDAELARLHRRAYTTLREIGEACSLGTSDGLLRATALMATAKEQFLAVNSRMAALNS